MSQKLLIFVLLLSILACMLAFLKNVIPRVSIFVKVTLATYKLKWTLQVILGYLKLTNLFWVNLQMQLALSMGHEIPCFILSFILDAYIVTLPFPFLFCLVVLCLM